MLHQVLPPQADLDLLVSLSHRPRTIDRRRDCPHLEGELAGDFLQFGNEELEVNVLDVLFLLGVGLHPFFFDPV